MRDDRIARAQRIDHAVVIVAVGGRDRQPVLKQLHAVLVVVGGIEIGAAAGDEEIVLSGGAFCPHARHVPEHVGQPGDIALVEIVAIDEGYRTGRRRSFGLEFFLDALGRHSDGLQGRRWRSLIGDGRCRNAG